MVSAASVAFTVIKGRYDEVTLIRPTLVFVYDHEHGWTVDNVGNGPALNVVVAKRDAVVTDPAGDWIDPVRVPPLKRDGSFPIYWNAHHDGGFGVTYEDMWGRLYTTVFEHERNFTRAGAHLTRWPESKIAAARTRQHAETPSQTTA